MTREEMRRLLRELPIARVESSVLRVLMDHMGAEYEPCTCSVSTICREAGYRERAVQGAVKRLVAKRIIDVIEVPGRPSQYHLAPDSDLAKIIATPARDAPPQKTRPARRADEGVEPEGRTTSALEVENHGSLFLEPETPSAPARERTPASPRAKRMPPNAELFEALIIGAGWDITKLTGMQRSRTGQAAKQLAEIGATADEVREQAEILDLAWQGKPAPWTVAAHWGSRPRTRALNANWTPKEKP